MARNHDNDTVIVTGAGSGIGYALTRRLLDEGYRVSGWDVAAGALDGANIEVDVTRGESVREMLAWIDANAGPVHAAFNCAGIFRRGAVDEITEEV